MAIFEGSFTDASKIRISVVVARFNDLVTGKLLVKNNLNYPPIPAQIVLIKLKLFNCTKILLFAPESQTILINGYLELILLNCFELKRFEQTI